jgi:spermidine synthase
LRTWTLLEETRTPDGHLMTLHTNGEDRVIRVNGRELMSSRHVHSEEQLAKVACEPLHQKPKARVLIGGLGLGFTLQEALSHLSTDATVVLAELIPAVVQWNQNPAYKLAGEALKDPRVQLEMGDVHDIISRARAEFDAIMLDTDNGTTAMNSAGNAQLYVAEGLQKVHAALRSGGHVVYWSAGADPRFSRLMEKCRFAVETQRHRLHPTSGGTHYLLIGRKR